jgi:hypothetical protein
MDTIAHKEKQQAVLERLGAIVENYRGNYANKSWISHVEALDTE